MLRFRKLRAPRVLLGLVFLSATLLSGCSQSPPAGERLAAEDGASYATDERPLSSLALIEAAVSSGALDYSTGLLYKVYVMFDPDSLPPEFRSDVPSKCGTPIILEVQQNWNMLAPADQAEVSQYIQPLGLPGDTETQLDDVSPDRLDHERERLD